MEDSTNSGIDPATDSVERYHIGFAPSDVPEAPRIAIMSGDPARSELIAMERLAGGRVLSRHRGLDMFAARLPNGAPVVCATSGMGAPSTSIVVNELVQVGIRCIIRVGTCGSIQPHVRVGSVVISSASLCRQGAARDIAPIEYPAAADPFVTVMLADAALELGAEHHVGVTASVDTFYEGQGRTESSANPHLLRHLDGIVDEYAALRILNMEMETGTLFTMGLVYGIAAGAVCAVIAQRTEDERPRLDLKDVAVEHALEVAIGGAVRWTERRAAGG